MVVDYTLALKVQAKTYNGNTIRKFGMSDEPRALTKDILLLKHRNSQTLDIRTMRAPVKFTDSRGTPLFVGDTLINKIDGRRCYVEYSDNLKVNLVEVYGTQKLCTEVKKDLKNYTLTTSNKNIKLINNNILCLCHGLKESKLISLIDIVYYSNPNKLVFVNTNGKHMSSYQLNAVWLINVTEERKYEYEQTSNRNSFRHWRN